jgi:membrane-bound lytic murein transglycosylase MltF
MLDGKWVMRVVPIGLVLVLTVTAAVPSPFAASATPNRELLSTHPRASWPAISQEKTAPQATSSLSLPLTFERHVGDLEGMNKRHAIRVLVVPSHSGFFYDLGQPHGIFYEAFNEFQQYVNRRFRTDSVKITVTFIPVRPDQLENALLEGVGDVIGYGVMVTPEREKEVLFTTPIESNVKEVIVTGPKAKPATSLQDLSGKAVFVNPLTDYYATLQRLNAELQHSGKPPILVKAADKNLTDEDLLEMVSAGLIPATATINVRADFWSKVLPQLTLNPAIVLKEDGQLAFVTRKDSPQLKQLLDEFVRERQVGTSFGNTLVRRYLENTKWVKDATSSEEMEKFHAYVRYFQKYAGEYGFDYLMLIAQGYQESLLNQNQRNPSGAVGIMQVIPKYAAAPPIDIHDVNIAQNNIEAGAKMLHNIAETYFNDPHLDQTNKTLMVFASYNAGPTRVARLRKKAASEGLDPNVWFGNVELVASRDIGQQTVQYVSNIYKYYVAYKLTLEQAKVPQ